MIKDFVPYDLFRNNALKLAHRIRMDGFYPDVIYASLRGGAYMANIISEYFKLARKDLQPVLYAAVVARSYTDVRQRSRVVVDGWTHPPEALSPSARVLLAEDIFDSGRTVNHLVSLFLNRGLSRENIRVAVYDYKYFTDREQLPIQPDYWCRKLNISDSDSDCWIHYMSHELIGLTEDELEKYYFKQDPELREVLKDLL